MKKIDKALDLLETLDRLLTDYYCAKARNRKTITDARAELEQLKRDLRGIEYCCDHPDYGYSWCPVCGGLDKDYPGCPPMGHTKDCWLAKAIEEGAT